MQSAKHAVTTTPVRTKEKQKDVAKIRKSKNKMTPLA